MRVEIAPEARTQVERRREWWMQNRSETALFDDELAIALTSLAHRNVALPVVVTQGARRIRRVLMPKTRCHLYFEVVGERVIVVAVWGAQMDPPSL